MLPNRMQKLVDIANEHGWEVVEPDLEDLPDLEGITEMCQRMFMRTQDHVVWAFVITMGRSEHTKRWQVLQLEYEGHWYRFVGVIFFEDDIVSEWYWKRAGDLDWYLANPDKIFTDGGVTIPTKTELALFRAMRNL